MNYKCTFAAVAACAAVACTGLPMPLAGDLVSSQAYADGVSHPKRSAKSKRAVRVRGYIYRGGYYSYTDEDAIDTRAWASSLFTSHSPLRNPLTERQSAAGPFDHGFFFESGVGPRFNDSPYPR